MMMISALYFHHVRIYMLPLCPVTQYAITPLISLLVHHHQPRIRQGNGIRAPLAATAAPASTAG
jgi:hypothetical protein